METLQTGALAYFDTMRSGLIPCKVLSIEARENQGHNVAVKLTAARGAYKRGETVSSISARYVVPRSAVRGLRGYSPRILPYYVRADGAKP
jgi:hypothetical protein